MTARVQVVIITLSLVFILVNGLAVAGDVLANVLNDTMQLVVGVFAVLCGAVGARRHVGRRRLWRLVIVSGMLGWSGGQVMRAWHQWTYSGALISPSWADIGYLSLPVFVLPALFIAAKGVRNVAPEPAREHRALVAAGHVLDGLIITTSLLTLAWAGVSGYTVRLGPDDPGDWVAIMYPVTSLLMVVVAVLVLVFKQLDPVDRRSFVLLAKGLVALSCSSSIYAYLVSIGAQSMKPWADAGFVLGPLLIGFAMLGTAPRNSKESATGGVGPASELVLPFGCLLAVGVLVVCQLVVVGRLEFIETWLALAVVLMVAVKQLTVLVDNRRLIRAVHQSQCQLAYQADHDMLTGLANRWLFSERLEEAVAERRPITVIFLDVDNLKDVNDRYGQIAGDAVLRAVGGRLVECVRRKDTVARLGGDEFAILIDGDTEPSAPVPSRISDALLTPFFAHGSWITVHVSMGVAVADPEESLLTADELTRRADNSMYEGKRLGKGATVVSEPTPASDQDFAAVLRNAGGGVPPGFVLRYQPITRMDGSIVAVEALARWTTQDGKSVAPSIFVPAADAAGLGGVFDVMVLELACREVRRTGFAHPVHVNIGPARLGDRAFEAAVAATIGQHGIAGDRLVLEVTETMPIANLTDAAGAIRRLQSLGVRVALDDFGTGYNSLMYLQALPVDLIKLDRSLTKDNLGDAEVLYHSVMKLCMAAGFGIVAEGIESAGQAERIRAIGCSFAQGYHFGRPARLDALAGRSRHGAVRV
ncbi:bifunctional diguanylate cyclase/phosphodiesterase [Mycolicibacterium sp. CBMA 234]|uniref:putative bifunctional diguanylate cyclase/phosphodiesterase n=1 Tax=Mycolicibacterium sp. CBMA 234 TaxID=1918495 RepID=UPI00192E5717|nr:bifunctional diguanylate cyclase/phosphodiesterase [Mycolicibacterium sp. CBMA 234]